MPGVSTKVTLSSSLWGISMPTSRSRKPWPNFSRGEKDRELSAAMTIPSMVRNFSPCITTVYSEVVGSAPGGRMKTRLFNYCICGCQSIAIDPRGLSIRTCVEFLRGSVKTQQVVDHGGLANTPGSQEQNHGLRGDLCICTVCVCVCVR